LERLNQLAHNSLAEMQLLFSELAPEKPGGFVSALKRHIDERRRLDNLLVELNLDGDHPLSPFEEQGLFRITQEALNNVVKHAKADHAVIHLQLGEQPYMEIEDHGIGFDPRQAPGQGRVGLVSMQERAAEIGWSLGVVSSPGNGTRVRVRKDSGDTK
jgi:signal transduction histidine kinase